MLELRPSRTAAENKTADRRRKHIIDSIKEKIVNFSEDISRYDAEINKYQIELNRVMEEDDVTIENIVAFKSGFTSIEEIDSVITEIDNQILYMKPLLSDIHVK